ncbi:MAG: YihY/virulence factor BrkB family protein [Rickettsiales bacterium]|nr:MAG: YihY/virulence factor BrkB family protein [Rickettsiales bacterium]
MNLNFINFKYKKFFLKLWKATYKTIFTFNLHGGVENAGFISFSLLFAIFPFMIFFMVFVSYFGDTNIGLKLLDIMKSNVPKEIADTIFPVIDSVINGSKKSIVSIASITLMWSASSLVQSITGVLNKAYRIKKTTSYLYGRLKSVFLFLLLIIFIVSMIFATIILPPILKFIDDIIPIGFGISDLLFYFSPLLLLSFLFIFVEFIYYVMPSKRKMTLKDTLWGSILTIIGWIISGKALSFYWTNMGNNNAVYGSFAGIILTLFFFNIMAMIFIFGAEFIYNIKDTFENKNLLKNKFKKLI